MKLISLLLLCLLIPLSLYSQEKVKKTSLEKILQPKLSIESSYLGDSILNENMGSVSIKKNEFKVNNEIIGLSYTNFNFDWKHLHNLPFGNKTSHPINKIHSFKMNVNIPYFINDNWFMLTAFEIESTFEDELDESFSAGVLSGLIYKLNEDHSIAFGIFGKYHPASSIILPGFSYNYRAREDSGFKFILGFPKTYISYNLNYDTSIRMGMIYSNSVIKLKDNSTIEDSGYIESTNIMTNIGVSYNINQDFLIESDLVYSLERNFVVYSQNGIQLNKYSLKPSLGINFKLTYKF